MSNEDEWEKVGETPEGYCIWRVPNKAIGGYDYVSDSVSCGYKVIDALASISELEVILADMKMLEKRARLIREKEIRKCLKENEP